MLGRICARILRDEEAHVRFQAQRLATLRRDREALGMVLTRLLHRAQFFGACLVVWRNHGAAIRRGGLGFKDYWRRSWEEFDAAMHMMEPRSYDRLLAKR